MMTKLASNKAFNAIKGLAGKIRRPSLIEGAMAGGIGMTGVGIWAGLRNAGGINKRLEKEGYLKQGVGYTGKM